MYSQILFPFPYVSLYLSLFAVLLEFIVTIIQIILIYITPRESLKSLLECERKKNDNLKFKYYERY